jgi:hypothetical protein
MKTSILGIYLLPLLAWASPFEQPRALMSVEERSYTDELMHGNYRRIGGEIYRMHQLDDGLFTGVKPDEWDEKGMLDKLRVRKSTSLTTCSPYQERYRAYYLV